MNQREHTRRQFLAGNLQLGDKSPGLLDGAWQGVKPWVMKDVGGFRIALIGLVTPGLPYFSLSDPQLHFTATTLETAA